MSDVYVRRRVAVGAGAAALVGLISFEALGSEWFPAVRRPSVHVENATSSRSPGSALRASIDAAGLTRSLNAELGARAADVSVAAYDRRTGTTFTYHPAMTNVSASIMKVLILAGIVQTRRAAGGVLTARDKGLAENMIEESDNASATALFSRSGGVPGVQRVATALGMSSTTVCSAWGLTTTTATDQVILMRAMTYGHPLLRAEDRAYMLSLMGDVDKRSRG